MIITTLYHRFSVFCVLFGCSRAFFQLSFISRLKHQKTTEFISTVTADHGILRGKCWNIFLTCISVLQVGSKLCFSNEV